jgi:hypothetical protein
MGDPINFYPSTGLAFTEFTDTVSTSKNDPDYCPKNYTFFFDPSNIPLTNFTFD